MECKLYMEHSEIRPYFLTEYLLQIHARLGEVLHIASTSGGSGNDATTERYLAESLRRYCRSIELCDDYLRGYYGLKLVR